MENCLVTLFNGKSTNPDLPMFGVIVTSWNASRTNFNYSASGWLRVKAKVDSVDGYFIKGGSSDVHYQEIDMSGDSVSFVKNATGKAADVLFYLDQAGVISGSLDLDLLQGSESVKLLLLTQGYIDDDTTKELITCYGAIDEIGFLFPNLEYFKAIYMGTITGNISSFAGCLEIKDIQLQYGTGITGSLEELAEAQVALGRTSGSVAVICNGVISYNGSVVPNNTTKTITYSGSGYTIS